MRRRRAPDRCPLFVGARDAKRGGHTEEIVMTRSLSRPSLLALALVTLPALGACEVATSNAQTRPAPTEPGVTVTTAAVATRALPRTLTLTGTLTASRESAVAADITGKVAETYVERGSRVRAGAPLVRLDRRQAALMEAE